MRRQNPTPTAYPDEESLAHCGYYTYIGPELSLYIDSKWAEVLTADEKYSAMIMPMFLGACVAGIIALNIVRATRKKRGGMIFPAGVPHRASAFLHKFPSSLLATPTKMKKLPLFS